ncbi:cyclic AMP-dependent transcription factor ATF-4 [Parasteatoda tepidariorum]|uniref:cyclic AMP-dependent transcription factor ATF-4 n=1 Tax=Parasteatoda tepidariorum TaxID=114398 RepID=UPI00077F9611|nr:cyclic AMP-dependent transcription factor ATF-4 [Parasteatoda tepidariorum]
MFSLPTLYFWWFGLYTTFKMMDYDLNLEGWLEDATLFHSNELSDFSLNFDLENGKTNDAAVQVTDFNDLPWYDEKVDLSIFEDTKNIQFSETDFDELLSIIGSNSDNSYLSSEIQNASNIDAFNFDLNVQSQVASPGSSIYPSSPGYETAEVHSPSESVVSEVGSPSEYLYSPECEPISEADSPLSCVSEVTIDSQISADFDLSVGNYESTYDSNGPNTMPAVFVTVVGGQHASPDEVAEALTIEEVSSSIRNKKYVGKVKEIPKVHVSLKNAFHPYSKATSKRGSNKAERKKIQNKEAAARYRVKRRIEEKGLSDEVSGLEAEQQKLQSKHDDLLTEIKYLKKLMREMLERKGLI